MSGDTPPKRILNESDAATNDRNNRAKSRLTEARSKGIYPNLERYAGFRTPPKPRPRAAVDLSRMVRPERFELPTFWFVARRSIQLS